jgi:hypothetical protein
MNRPAIVSLAARRKGIARSAVLHFDDARSAWGRGRYRFHVGEQFSFVPIAAVVLPSGGVSIWINKFRQVTRGVIQSD